MEKKEEKLLLSGISDRMFESIQNKVPLEKRQALLIKLGIDTILNVIPKLILTIVLALFLKELLSVSIFVISFLALRGFAYGRHLKSDLLCTILTITVFVGVPYLISFTDGIPIGGRILVSAFITLGIGILAPADTKKNPITSNFRRQKLKRKAILVSTILSLVQFITHNYIGTVIVVAMFTALLLLLPLKGVNYNEKNTI